MATDNTTFISSFTKGMNTDVSYQMLDNSTYSYGQNIRIFSVDSGSFNGYNNQYGEVKSIEGVSNVYEDSLENVYGGEINNITIKASCVIRDYGILVIEEELDESHHPWHVVIFENKISKDTGISEKISKENIRTIYSSSTEDGQFNENNRLGGTEGVDKVSVVVRYETEDNIKLYIADGIHYIFILNIMDDEYNLNASGDIKNIQMYPRRNFNKILFNGFTTGMLTSRMVQYSYRLYNRNGISSDMSVPTRLIPIVRSNKNDFSDGKSIKGGDKDENMGVGVKIVINVDSDLKYMDRIMIYRISYFSNTEVPQIDLISDQKYDSETIRFTDSGQESLQILTIDEYNSLSGVHIIPNVIESMQDYMFAANIKSEKNNTDDLYKDFDARSYRFNSSNTAYLFNYSEQNSPEYSITDPDIQNVDKNADCYNLYNDMSKLYAENDTNKYSSCKFTKKDDNGTQYYGGTGKYISWRFIITTIVGDSTPTTIHDKTKYRYPVGANDNIVKFDSQSVNLNKTIKYVKSNGDLETSTEKFDLSDYIYSSYTGTNTYADAQLVYSMKSLKRDELYRYGIILYDAQGNASSVKWIADIRTPGITNKGFHTYQSNSYDGNVQRNLTVNALGIQFDVDIEKYNNEHLENPISAYEIVRCNRTENDIVNIAQGVISRPIKMQLHTQVNSTRVQDFPYTPTGLMTTANICVAHEQKRFYKSLPGDDTEYEADNYENYGIYQFVSPEVLYAEDSVYQSMNNNSVSLNPVRLIFGQDINYDPSNYMKFTYDHTSDVSAVSTSIGNLNMRLPGQDRHDMGMDFILQSGQEARIYDTNRATSIRQLSDCTPMTYYWKYPKNGVNNYKTKDWNYYYYQPGHALYEDDLIKSIVYGNIPYNATKVISAYSKLYEQSDDVLLRKYPDLKTRRHGVAALYDTEGKYQDLTDEQQVLYMNCVLGYIKGFDRIKLSNPTLYKISDTKKASELQWNNFIIAEQSDNKTTYSYSYTSHLDGIGSNSYCNFVCGPTYNNTLQIDGTKNMDDMGNDINGTMESATEALDNFMFGLGGRCLLISLTDEDNNIFKTIGTDTILNYTNGYTKYTSDDLISVNQEYNGKNLKNDSDSEFSFFKNSILSTYLCNVRKDTIPYGAPTYISRSNDNYYSYGDVFKNTNNVVNIFDGDCVIMPMEYVSQHKTYPQCAAKFPTTCIIYAIPVETSILLGYTNGFEYSKNYENSGITNIQIEPADVNNIYIQSDPLYKYNTVYSSNPASTIYVALTEDDNSLDEVDYRCYYSNQKVNNEDIDSWTIFRPSNYLDVDTRYGQITNMRAFMSKLFFWQENAFGVFSVNERAQISEENGQTLTLGTSGILSRHDYLDRTSGMRKNQYNDTQSFAALYWYDNDNKELKQYSNQITPLNKQYSTKSLINKHSNNNPELFFDNKYQELVSNVLDDSALAYNERNQMFTSVYTVLYDTSIKFDNGIYLILTENDKLKIGQWNVNDKNKPHDMNGNILTTKLEYCVNPVVTTTKVFDNQELVTANRLYADKSLPTSYFSKKHKYSWTTDLYHVTTDDLQMTCREGNYRYAIPRAKDKDGEECMYGNRMRGKYMVCRIEDFANDQDASLSYIITKYRGSWT